MINREEYQLLSELDKALNQVYVSGKNAILLGKCIESLERFLMIKQQEIIQQEQFLAQQQSNLEKQENIPKEEE